MKCLYRERSCGCIFGRMKTLLKFASLVLLLAATPLFAQSTGAWRAVGSVGIIDESALSLYAFSQFDLEFKTGQVGTIPARYPVFPAGDDTPDWSSLIIGGSGSGVTVKLIQAGQCIPQNPPTVLCQYGPSNASLHFCQPCDEFFGGLDFSSYAYYFEVELTRATTATNPKLHMISLE
jgi:hypothetical protein